MVFLSSILLIFLSSLPFPDANFNSKIDCFSSDLTARGPHSFDVLYYDVQLEIFEDIQEIEGIVGIHFQSELSNLDEITLDLLALTVDSVWDSQGVLSYSQIDSFVTVDLSVALNTGDTTTVYLSFAGSPENSGFGGFFWNRPLEDYMTHYTVGMEPMSGRWVFPCWDDIYDKASINTHLTVNDTLFAVACGELESIETGSGTKTYHWNHPEEISLYIWAIAISNYTVVDDTTYSWIKYYTPAEYAQYIEQIFGNVNHMIDCFEERNGDYPWGENLGFPFLMTGGAFCEHNTIPFTLVTHEPIVAHEIAHHWWGNLVTEEEWADIWLAEGFATYSEAVWEEWHYGEEAYFEYTLGTMITYLNSGEMFPIVPAENYWTNTVYKKGGSVMHMLRHVMGEEDFFEGLRGYLTANAYGSTTTEDLIEALEVQYGDDLEWFFDTWVYDWGYPEYQLSWEAEQSGSEWNIDITIEQVQSIGPVFEMPVDLLVEGTGQDTLIVMWNDIQTDEQTFVVNFEPVSVTFDPNNWILRAGLQTGLKEGAIEVTSEVTVFPNPARYSISVGWLHHGDFKASLFDISGRCVVQSEVSVRNPFIDVSTLPSGMYQILVEVGEERSSASVVILGGADSR